MKLLIWLVIVPLLVIAALFAISNREPVAVGLWPFFDGVTMPLFAALIGTLYIGFVLGAVVGNAYIVQSGLNAGDRVIVSGLQKIQDGARVTPMPAGGRGAAAGPGAGS